MPVRDIEAIWALQNSTENELRMEGILVKRGDRWLRRWEKRRFVLAFGVLSYFPRKSGGEPRAQMELGEDTFVREALRADRGNCFEVGNGDRVWMMQGETADDVKRWTAAILRETKVCAARKGHGWGVPGCGMMHVAAWRSAELEVEHGVAQTTGDDDAMPSRLDVTVPLEDAMTSCHDPSAAEQPHDSCAASSGEGGAGGASSGGGEGADAADEKTDGETDEKTEEDENTGGFQVVTEPLTAKNLAAFFKPRPRKAAAGDGSSAQAEDADIADGKTDVETDGFQVVTKPLTKADVSSFFKPRSRPPIEDATVHVASSAEAVASSPVVGEDVISSSQAGGEDLPSLCKAADDSENAGDTQEGLQKGEALWAGGEGGEGSVGGEEECQEGSGGKAGGDPPSTQGTARPADTANEAALLPPAASDTPPTQTVPAPAPVAKPAESAKSRKKAKKAASRAVGVLFGSSTGASDEEESVSVEGLLALGDDEASTPGSAAVPGDLSILGEEGGASGGGECGCGVVFTYMSGDFVVLKVLEGSSAARHNARGERERSFAHQIKVGDRLAAVDDAPCGPGSSVAQVQKQLIGVPATKLTLALTRAPLAGAELSDAGRYSVELQRDGSSVCVVAAMRDAHTAEPLVD